MVSGVVGERTTWWMCLGLVCCGCCDVLCGKGRQWREEGMEVCLGVWKDGDLS